MDSPVPPPVPAGMPSVATPKKISKGLLWVIGSVIVIFIAALAWMLWIPGIQMPESSPSPSATDEVIPTGWQRFDSSLVNLSFYYPPGATFREVDSLEERLISSTGLEVLFDAGSSALPDFRAITNDFSVVDSIPHDLVDGDLQSADSFRVTVFDEKFTSVKLLGNGIYQVTGYGNMECSPFVSSLLMVRPPVDSNLKYIQFFLGGAEDFVEADMLPGDTCTPTDKAIRERIASVVDGKAASVQNVLPTALAIAGTFGTTQLAPYTLDCEETVYGSEIDTWGTKYSWYPAFKNQIVPGWSVSQACYNEHTNEVAYIKSRGDLQPQNQLGIYHVHPNYFSKAPEVVAPLYGGCEVDRWTPVAITFSCMGGDGGSVAKDTYRYTLGTGLLELIRICGGSDITYGCDTVVDRIAQIFPWCSSTAMPSDIGSVTYESDPKYIRLGGYLGQVLTASECDAARFQEVAGGPSGIYTWGIALRLEYPPTAELKNALMNAGFEPVECTDNQCVQWNLTEEVPVRNLLFLRNWLDSINSADCIHCG